MHNNWESDKMNKNQIRHLKLGLDSLSVYRGILEIETIEKLHKLLTALVEKSSDFNGFLRSYNDFYFELIDKDTTLYEEVRNSILYLDNAFAKQAEKTNIDKISKNLLLAVENDLKRLSDIAELSSNVIKNAAEKLFSDDSLAVETIKHLAEWETEVKENWVFNSNDLAVFFNKNGYGIFAKHFGFIWESNGGKCHLRGIDSPDNIRLSQLIGYELERKEVILNTIKFLQGYPANNVLLYGDRGTGKSSTVKAILNEYHDQGLRMIELPKALLSHFSEVIRLIKDRAQKFVIFIDDLAFEDNEERYTALKAILEGSLEPRPENVVIYATSNRKHLIKEKFSDRAGLMYGTQEDEIRAQDTMQEKLSLADRFGITLTFSAPDKERYLKIIDGIAEERKLVVDKEILHMEALKWEMWQNGRSPRTARQFIDWYEGYLLGGKQVD